VPFFGYVHAIALPRGANACLQQLPALGNSGLARDLR
jgi:hypothetical protein